MAVMNAADRQLVLTGEEIAVIRQALVTCAQLICRAAGHGPQASALLAEVARRLPGGRSPGGLLHDIALAIDYLDFAPAARGAGPAGQARLPARRSVTGR
jgi:hypothetical protein